MDGYSRKSIRRAASVFFCAFFAFLIGCGPVWGCEHSRRVKIYCYISAAGLLWSNWCEYKLNLGIEFGEYSLMQYRYAKEYAKLALKEMER